MTTAEAIVIDTDLALEEAVGSVTGPVAFDTEFIREKTYRARLCLVQLATAEWLYLVDPLETDLAPVAALIADPRIEIVTHAGKQDFEIFYEAFGTVPAAVYDVQLAAGFAGYGASLPYGRLVEAVTGQSLPKGEAYSEWCRRPLTPAQLEYAANDVRFLLDVAARLRARIEELGRTEWVAQEMALLEGEDAYGSDPAEAWRRVSGRGSLSRSQLAALRELARWREEEAARRDIPRGWLVKDVTLVEIARRKPRDARALRSIRGMPGREAERSASAISRALERARTAPTEDAPRGLPRSVQVRSRLFAGLADAVVRSRCEAASIATELVATRGELEAAIADLIMDGDVDRHRLLRGWRRELAGGAVADLVAGRIAVKATTRPPWVEEVRL